MAENIDSISGEAFNFGGGDPISVKDLVKLISRLFDGQEREPIFHGAKKEVPVHKCLDTGKAKKVLGWQPSISLEDGLKETIDWYKQYWSRESLNKLPYRGNNYSNNPVESGLNNDDSVIC